jgi:hypothetical protein
MSHSGGEWPAGHTLDVHMHDEGLSALLGGACILERLHINGDWLNVQRSGEKRAGGRVVGQMRGGGSVGQKDGYIAFTRTITI